MGLGAILFVLAYIFWTYLFPYQDIAGIALLAVGAIVAFLPASMRSSEKDIDEAKEEYDFIAAADGFAQWPDFIDQQNTEKK